MDNLIELNQNSFDKLYEKYNQKVKSYIYRLTTCREDTEDLAQETFIKAIRKLDTFRGDSSFQTWIFTIATNTVKNHYKAKQRWPINAQDLFRDSALKSQDEILDVIKNSSNGSYEIYEHINYCFSCIIKTLELEEQIAVILKDIYGLKVKEIESVIGRTTSVVKHLLHNGRNTLNKIFEKKCSLINKKGFCSQCSALNELLNQDNSTKEKIEKIEMVKAVRNGDKESLLSLRSKLVSAINPLDSKGMDLQFLFMDITKTAAKLN